MFIGENANFEMVFPIIFSQTAQDMSVSRNAWLDQTGSFANIWHDFRIIDIFTFLKEAEKWANNL